MNASFRRLIEEADRKVHSLRRCKAATISNKKKFPAVPGVYVISNGSKNLYVGLAGNLKRRLAQHANGRQQQSAFTLKLAAHLFRKRNRTKAPISLNKLRRTVAFHDVYKQTAEQIGEMKARYVQADNLRLRLVLEVYAGIVFKTKWNDFNLKDKRS